jgi:sodium-dependent dicarboxylate transporter 2/3/5
VTGRRPLVHALGGPAAFLLLAFAPLASMPYPVRASLGLLIWMSWWWVTEPVHLAVTAFLPVVVLALFNFLPVATILPAYSEPLVMLLIGANILATLWRRCGLTGASRWCRCSASAPARGSRSCRGSSSPAP